MAISRRLRFEILRRDGYTCRYCGAKAPDVVLEVDHVIPTTLGGSDDPSNLVTACDDCNSGKASVPPDANTVQDVEDDALRWKQAIEQAAFYKAIERETINQQIDEWAAVWDDWKYNPGDRKKKIPVPRDEDWRNSIETFLNLGLPPEEMSYLVSVTMKSKAILSQKWKFFCGCCWHAITDLQETARQILENGTV